MRDVELIDISSYVEHIDNMYAHKKEQGSKETLREHMETTIFFFYDLLDKKGLESILKNIIEDIAIDGKPLAPSYSNLVKRLFVNAIYLHDIGKINPAFQREKMVNTDLEDIKDLDVGESDHSLLSALLYIDIFIPEIRSISDSKVGYFMHILLYSFAYIISRHHTYLKDTDDFLTNLSTLLEKKIKRKPDYLHYYKPKDILGRTFANDIFVDRVKHQKNFLKNCELDYYILNKLLFSLLTGCDFYATYYYANSKLIDYGLIENIGELFKAYRSTDIYSGIGAYSKDKQFFRENPINALRSEMFLEAEKNLLENLQHSIFYLEAPTGGGKTNTSINLALNILRNSPLHKKIFYIFPFNTLVEQTKRALDKSFEKLGDKEFNIAVINSVTPIITQEEKIEKDIDRDYEKYLIDRQFLHYPLVLTTHINFFNYLFGTGREVGFPLIHLCNSVVIIDEIQSYRNDIWMEIIMFLERYSKLLNIKIIIMSATLPKLNELLRAKNSRFVELIEDKRIYYENSLFKERVQLDFNLLNLGKICMEQLIEAVVKAIEKHGPKRILIEFIKKASARDFYNKLRERMPQKRIVELTGDDNIINRNKVLNEINKKDKQGNIICKDIVVVATQVIEAGVDIDMDIGFKDISMLDNEEQFLGRINRSCSKQGCVVYFFDLDDAKKVYKKDFRLEKSLHEEEYRQYLKNKNFEEFYKRCFSQIYDTKGQFNENNIVNMINDAVALNFSGIEKRMELIEDKYNQLFLAHEIIIPESNEVIDGIAVWENYRNLIFDNDMEYARKIVELSKIYEKMSYFLYNYSREPGSEKYKFSRNVPPIYDEVVGDIYFVKNGEAFITADGKFDREGYREKAESDVI